MPTVTHMQALLPSPGHQQQLPAGEPACGRLRVLRGVPYSIVRTIVLEELPDKNWEAMAHQAWYQLPARA